MDDGWREPTCEAEALQAIRDQIIASLPHVSDRWRGPLLRCAAVLGEEIQQPPSKVGWSFL